MLLLQAHSQNGTLVNVPHHGVKKCQGLPINIQCIIFLFQTQPGRRIHIIFLAPLLGKILATCLIHLPKFLLISFKLFSLWMTTKCQTWTAKNSTRCIAAEDHLNIKQYLLCCQPVSDTTACTIVHALVKANSQTNGNGQILPSPPSLQNPNGFK